MIVFRDTSLVLGGRVVLDRVTLEVPAGRSVAVVGRTGAGKTSLLAVAAAAVRPSGGDVVVHGRSVRNEPAAVRRLVGYVPAQPPAWPPGRVGEFLELAGLSAGLVGRPLRTAVARALEMAGLTARSGAPIDSLPDGSGRRLLLARALLHDPEVLLLDGPFLALDPAGRRGVEDLVGDARLMGRTVIAASDAADVPECFTHLVVLEEGSVSAAGAADPATFAAGRRFAFRLVCPARADEAAGALRAVGIDARATDPDHATATIDPGRTPGSRLVAAVVAAGIPVAAAGFHPAWPAQLLG